MVPGRLKPEHALLALFDAAPTWVSTLGTVKVVEEAVTKVAKTAETWVDVIEGLQSNTRQALKEHAVFQSLDEMMWALFFGDPRVTYERLLPHDPKGYLTEDAVARIMAR